ncbi:hypothetical protein PPACK8108_LOCUS14507 [Phakopsora pachyrhizi]|uniref:Uncharacterized protein n=1 Tax=Phakopsora pachyrhizi TaxID=170000 RepID=A0AAV0B502_PHAPC|nr:hypothetical protein PPACK8108_LOCUS14507 [Phakopsora pachyrhizi]
MRLLMYDSSTHNSSVPTGYLGVFLSAAQDTEIQTSKTWIRRCESCTAMYGTPNVKDTFEKEKKISGGYTFNASLESCRCQAKYIKLEKLFAAAFLTEKALFVSVTLSEQIGMTQSGETQSEVNTCLSPQSHNPNQKVSRPLSSIKLPTRIESGSIKNDIDRHQQEQNEREDKEQKESQLCDSDDLVMMDSWSGVVDIVKSVCGGYYNEDDLDFELDEMDDSVCGVQRASDHVSSYSNRRNSCSLLEI